MNYEKIYNQIIQRAKDENRKKVKGGIYYERHHIVPRCMGGNNDKLNLILLTAKEHYMAHRLLYEIYPDHKGLQYAIWNMINGRSFSKKRYVPSGRIYAQLRETYANMPRSEETRKKLSDHAKSRPPRSKESIKKSSDARKGCIPWNKGKLTGPLSEEVKISMRLAAKTRPAISEETRKKMSEAGKKRIVSNETRKKLSEIVKLYYLKKKNNFDS
jgi:hypothetical protein